MSLVVLLLYVAYFLLNKKHKLTWIPDNFSFKCESIFIGTRPFTCIFVFLNGHTCLKHLLEDFQYWKSTNLGFFKIHLYFYG